MQEGRKGGDMVWNQRDLRDYPWEGGTLWAQRLHARHEGPSLGRQGSTADSEALTGKQIYPVFVEMIINCLKWWKCNICKHPHCLQVFCTSKDFSGASVCLQQGSAIALD